jgi:hypothetical protein
LKIVDNNYIEVSLMLEEFKPKVQLTVAYEWSALDVVIDGGQLRGNSGVFQNRYEL